MRFRLVAVIVLAIGIGGIAATTLSAATGEGAGEKRTVTAKSVKNGPHGWIAECTATSGGANTKLDCDDPFPNNDPNIVVDSANPQHMIASSNDYGSCCDEYYTTFDAGTTWSTGNMSVEDKTRTGSDPVTSIDVKHGVALHSSLNYNFNAAGDACDGDVVVSPSPDGGLTWKKPAVVYGGLGCDPDPTQIFNDKEWITTDNNPASRFYGRTYLTWTRFLSHNEVGASSAIWESHSDDGGKNWSTPHEISGANSALCPFQSDGPAGVCDEDQASVPTVGPDGTVYVAFMNSQNSPLWESGEVGENQYLVVRSTNGGATWSSPRFVVALEDGSLDDPIHAEGLHT